jgi:hypothetical protein
VSGSIIDCLLYGCYYVDAKTQVCVRCGTKRPSGQVVGKSPIATLMERFGISPK